MIHSEGTQFLCPMHNQTVCGMGSISVYYVINVYDSYKYTSEPFYIKLWDWSNKSLAHARFRARSTGCVAPAVTRGLLCSGWRRYGFTLSLDAHRVPETVTLSFLSSQWGQSSLWRTQFTWPDRSTGPWWCLAGACFCPRLWSESRWAAQAQASLIW